jgi:hypothetical protein
MSICYYAGFDIIPSNTVSSRRIILSAIRFLKEEEVMLVSLKPRYSIVKI